MSIKKYAISSLLLAGCMSIANAGMYVAPTLLLQDTIAPNSTVRDMSLRVSLGYDDFIQPSFYLGGEIFGTPGSIQLKNNTSSGTSARNSYSYGASILPGTPITDTVLGFLRIGVIETRFTSASATRAGGQLGLGLDTALNCNWNLRMEYTYTMYGSVTGIGAPKSDWVGLGLTYKLGQLDQ